MGAFGFQFIMLLPLLLMYASFLALAVWAVIALFRVGTAYKRLADARESARRAQLGKAQQ